MAGLTPEGFEARSLEEVVDALESSLQEEFGNIALDPETVFGQLVGIVGEARARLWQQAENVYLSQYPSTASDISLDRVVGLNNITRLPARPTTVEAEVYGIVGTLVSGGREASSSETGEIFTLDQSVQIALSEARSVLVQVDTVADSTNYTLTVDGSNITHTSGTDADATSILTGLQGELPGDYSSTLDDEQLRVVFDDSYEVSVSANLDAPKAGTVGRWTAQDAGPVPLPAETLDTIDTAVSGWDEVINREAGITGRAQETDAELRSRRQVSIRVGADGPFDALVANIRQADGVTLATVVQNTTDSTDSDGVPAHSIWAIVAGGTDQDVAEAIFQKLPAGIGTYGDETVTVESTVTEQTFDIDFGRPTQTPVFIEADLVTNGNWPADGVSRIKTAIVAMFDSLQIGQDLRYSRLFTPLNSVPGHYVDDLQVGISDPASGTANLVAETDELFTVDPDDITINVS